MNSALYVIVLYQSVQCVCCVHIGYMICIKMFTHRFVLCIAGVCVESVTIYSLHLTWCPASMQITHTCGLIFEYTCTVYYESFTKSPFECFASNMNYPTGAIYPRWLWSMHNCPFCTFYCYPSCFYISSTINILQVVFVEFIILLSNLCLMSYKMVANSYSKVIWLFSSIQGTLFTEKINHLL